MSSYGSLADDFFLNIGLHTALELPSARETVLQFCEAVQKEFPQMTSFYQGEGKEFILEGDRQSGSYRWMEVHPQRLLAGYFNPPAVEDAYALHRWLLRRSVFFLGVSALDVDSLDVTYGFNMDYRGNRDKVVAEALLGGSALGAFALDEDGCNIGCEPAVIIALDEECSLQARLSVETRSSAYQVQSGQYEDEPISLYLTVRGYPTAGRLLQIEEAFADQCRAGEGLIERLVIPQVIRSIAAAIAAAQ